MSSDSWTFKC